MDRFQLPFEVEIFCACAACGGDIYLDEDKLDSPDGWVHNMPECNGEEGESDNE